MDFQKEAEYAPKLLRNFIIYLEVSVEVSLFIEASTDTKIWISHVELLQGSGAR